MKHFTEAPVLMHLEPSTRAIFAKDVSDVGVDAVLFQRSPAYSKIHPCAFFSKKFTTTEINSSIGGGELLANRLALEKWRQWPEGIKLPVIILDIA